MNALAEPALERAIRHNLGFSLRLAFAARPLDAAKLSAGERTRFASLAAGARRTEWLTGRAALKRLLTRLGASADTSGIAFPNASYSLAHSGGTAVAAGAGGRMLRGIGIDLELHRCVNPRAARYFLSAREWSSLEQMGADGTDRLLRLWTVKEALFKADPNNAHRVLADYRLLDPLLNRGRAILISGGDTRFSYASFRVPGGYLSAAVSC